LKPIFRFEHWITDVQQGAFTHTYPLPALRIPRLGELRELGEFRIGNLLVGRE